VDCYGAIAQEIRKFRVLHYSSWTLDYVVRKMHRHTVLLKDK